MRRVHVSVTGTVQGVGFRPFVFRLASELGLKGWVRNDPAGGRVPVLFDSPCHAVYSGYEEEQHLETRTPCQARKKVSRRSKPKLCQILKIVFPLNLS